MPKRPTSHLLFLILSFFFLPEIEKCEGDELRKDGDMKKYLDVISNKNIKLSERVLIPIQQYPKVGHAADVVADAKWPKLRKNRNSSNTFCLL